MLKKVTIACSTEKMLKYIEIVWAKCCAVGQFEVSRLEDEKKMKTKIKMMALVAGLLATADDFRFAARGEH